MSLNPWKRRERSMAAGVILWALTISAAATLAPGALGDWLVSTPGPEVAGTIMISTGLSAAFVDTLQVAATRWVSTPETEDLTEVPWDE